MEWVIAAAVVVAILILAVFLASGRHRRPSDSCRREIVGPDRFPLSPPARQAPSKLSAAEMLSLVHRLRDQNAQWDVILAALNPTNDAEVQRLLIGIRGPHMFVPHLGLSVIEDGCKRALASSPNADALDALREATRSQDPFVRY